MANKYIGIDLGTTNTLVSYYDKGKTKTIKFDGKDILPSALYVDVDNNNEIIIGKEAIERGTYDPDNFIKSSKTYIGTSENKKYILADGTIEMTPTDVACEILKKVKNRVERKFKLTEEDEIHAVITTPAAFSAKQNDETAIAAERAGLKVIGIKPEPMAAAAAAGCEIPNSTIFVVDIGGGTYDTAFIEYDENLMYNPINSEGDRKLGGDDIDKEIFEYIKEDFKMESGIDISSQKNSNLPKAEYYRLISILKGCAIELKECLTNDTIASCARNNMIEVDGQDYEYSITLTRDQFNDICKDIYKRIEDRLDISLAKIKEAGYDTKNITKLLLVGGTCMIPKIIEIIEKKVGKKSEGFNMKTTAVARGAALIADAYTNPESSSLANLKGIVAQSMGVSRDGGIFEKLITKGSTYPCKMTKKFTTTMDNQKQVEIQIYIAYPDKEDVLYVEEHEYFGNLVLENIQDAKAGVPDIEVTFEFNADQRLIVSAKDLSTMVENKVTILKEYKATTQKNDAPASIDLLIDVSGSMCGTPLKDAKNACKRMISEIINLNSSELGISAFNTQYHNIYDLSQNKEKLLLSVDKMFADYSTRMDNGIKNSAAKLKNAKNQNKFIIIMSDGDPDRGDKSHIIAKEIREKSNIRLAVIYIGKKSDRGYKTAKAVAAANTLTGENELFYTSAHMSELGNIFRKVYADITIRK